MAAIDGRAVHAYHVEGAGGGHVPDLIGIVREPHVVCSSTTPTIPYGRGAAAEHPEMILAVHGGSADNTGDVEAASERVHPATMAAEGPLQAASRAWYRLAAAMLRWPAIFMIPIVRLRSVAMTWGPLPVRTWEGVLAVSGVAEMVQGLDAPVTVHPPGELGRGGLGDGQAGDRVDRDGPPLLPAGQRADPAGDAQGLGSVREGQPGGDSGGLERAVFVAAVP